jgi:hypothetical protein
VSAVTWPQPSGWRAACLVPTCGFLARGNDEADAEAGLLEHLRLEHATVEPDPQHVAERCAVCGGLNPGDSSHVRCM